MCYVLCLVLQNFLVFKGQRKAFTNKVCTTLQGFATFAEDFIHSSTLEKIQIQRPDVLQAAKHPMLANVCPKDLSVLRLVVRYKTLQSEVESTPKDHQIIRPMKGQELKDQDTNVKYVKNGQNPEMAYTQVHYIKGYFLLHFLCERIGQDNFFELLRHYIHGLFHGKLVHSTHFLALYFEKFPFEGKTQDQSIQQTCHQWLDDWRLPPWIVEKYQSIECALLDQVIEQTDEWIKVLKGSRKRPLRHQQGVVEVGAAFAKANNVQTLVEEEMRPPLPSILPFPEQILLLLENLLEKGLTSTARAKRGLAKLDQIYQFRNCNADVQHRWCELVIMCEIKEHFPFVENFLRNQQAMGLYLYGEMAISQNKVLNAISLKVFEDLRDEFDPSTLANLTEMLKKEEDDGDK